MGLTHRVALETVLISENLNINNELQIFFNVDLPKWEVIFSEHQFIFHIHPPPGLLPVLGPLERNCDAYT